MILESLGRILEFWRGIGAGWVGVAFIIAILTFLVTWLVSHFSQPYAYRTVDLRELMEQQLRPVVGQMLVGVEVVDPGPWFPFRFSYLTLDGVFLVRNGKLFWVYVLSRLALWISIALIVVCAIASVIALRICS